MAIWQEHRDLFGDGGFLGISQCIDDVAPWFPLDRIVTEIHDRLSDVQPARHDEDARYQDTTQNFAAHVLRIHANRSQNAKQAEAQSTTSPPDQEIGL
jgi:hypothetical protein